MTSQMTCNGHRVTDVCLVAISTLSAFCVSGRINPVLQTRVLLKHFLSSFLQTQHLSVPRDTPAFTEYISFLSQHPGAISSETDCLSFCKSKNVQYCRRITETAITRYFWLHTPHSVHFFHLPKPIWKAPQECFKNVNTLSVSMLSELFICPFLLTWSLEMIKKWSCSRSL